MMSNHIRLYDVKQKQGLTELPVSPCLISLVRIEGIYSNICIIIVFFISFTTKGAIKGHSILELTYTSILEQFSNFINILTKQKEYLLGFP